MTNSGLPGDAPRPASRVQGGRGSRRAACWDRGWLSRSFALPVTGHAARGTHPDRVLHSSSVIRHSSFVIWLGLALALALRVGAVLVYQALPSLGLAGRAVGAPARQPLFPDSAEYWRMAHNLRLGKGLMVSDDCLVGRMPGYPVFLALIHSVAGESAGAVRLAQAVVGTALVGLVWLLARELLGEREASVAAALAAVYPPFVLYPVLILSETLFTTLLAWGVLCLTGAIARERTASAILAGVVLGLATLVRASLLPFVGLSAAAWVLYRRFRLGTMGRSALMLGAFAATMAPWVVRNWSASGGHLVVTTLRAGASLYEGLNPDADGGPMMDRINWDWGTKGLGEWERDQLWRARALEFARGHPGRLLGLALRKLGRFWNPLPNASEFRAPWLIVATAPPFLAVVLLGLVGLWRTRRGTEALLILLLPVVYYSAVHMVFVSSIRYREPVMPMLILLAARGATRRTAGARTAGEREV